MSDVVCESDTTPTPPRLDSGSGGSTCTHPEQSSLPGNTYSSDDDKVVTRERFPSYNNCGDVDSSTELWDDEDDQLCSTCALHDRYTQTLRAKIQDQQQTLTELKGTVKSLEVDKIKEVELRRQLQETEALASERETQIGRLESLVEELDHLAQENEDMKMQLQMKDEEIHLLTKDLSRLSERVSDYNEMEAHNTDLQSELFSRDREVMSLKHSEERMRTTYLELVKKNTHLEDTLLQQDGKHEEEKKKFENSIVQLTNKLIGQRKRCDEMEQANAKAVRDCRLAVRLLQCSSPGSNEHSVKFNQPNKLAFLFGDEKNRPISSNDSKKNTKDLKQLRQDSVEDDTPNNGSEQHNSQDNNCRSVTRATSNHDESSPPLRKNNSTGCLERPASPKVEEQDSVSVLKDLLQGKKDAIHVLRVELGKRDKEILLLRKKLTNNLSESINSKNMGPSERIHNLESRVNFLNDENFNLKYQLEICRKMLDKLSGVNANNITTPSK